MSPGLDSCIDAMMLDCNAMQCRYNAMQCNAMQCNAMYICNPFCVGILARVLRPESASNSREEQLGSHWSAGLCSQTRS